MTQTVTFIGGPANLTQRAYPQGHVAKYMYFPVMPSRAVFHDADSEIRVSCGVAKYVVTRVGPDHFAAVYEGLSW